MVFCWSSLSNHFNVLPIYLLTLHTVQAMIWCAICSLSPCYLDIFFNLIILCTLCKFCVNTRCLQLWFLSPCIVKILRIVMGVPQSIINGIFDITRYCGRLSIRLIFLLHLIYDVTSTLEVFFKFIQTSSSLERAIHHISSHSIVLNHILSNFITLRH